MSTAQFEPEYLVVASPNNVRVTFKKAAEPMAVIGLGEYVRDIFDDGVKGDETVLCNRDMTVMELAEDGSYVKMWVSPSMKSDVNSMWSPKSLHQEIIDNVGYPAPTATLTMGDPVVFEKCMNPCWEHTLDWQADALNYLMSNDGYEVVFSHFHAPDLQKHMFIRYMKDGRPQNPAEQYEHLMQLVYTQADRYIGRFLHFIDEGKFAVPISELMKGVNWEMIFLLVATIPICTAMEGQDTGIIPSLMTVVMPILSMVSPVVFMALALCTIIITQFAHNMILLLVFGPVLAQILSQYGVPPIVFCAVFMMVIQTAVATPGASANSAMLFGNTDWVDNKQALILGWTFVTMAILVYIFIAIPINMFFAG